MRTWLRISAAVAIAATAITTAGCASKGGVNAASSKDPKAAVSASFHQLNDHRSVTYSLHLKDDNGNLLKAMTSGKDGMPGIYAKRIIAGEIRVTVSAPAGKTVGEVMGTGGGQSDFSFSVVDQGSAMAEVLAVGGDLYARLDIAKIREFAGGSASGLAAGLGQISPALAAGEYVKIPQFLKTIQDLGAGMGGGTAPTTAPTAAVKQLQTQLFAALTNVITYTSKGNGEYGFSLDAKAAATAFMTVFSGNASIFGAAASAGLGKAQTEIAKMPTGEITGTVSVKDGAFSAFSLDIDSIATLAKKSDAKAQVPSFAGVSLTLDATFGSDGITAPAKSTPLDLKQIFGGLMGGLGG